MPDGLLLLAFALTLVVNAVLIAVAIRALRPGGVLHDGPARRDVASRREVESRVPEATSMASGPSPSTVQPRPRPLPPPPAASASDARGPEQSDPMMRRQPAVVARADVAKSADRKPAPAGRPRRGPAADTPAAASPPEPKTRNGRRRRFSLPPLDDDHEKVNRSIETFLSGGDATVETGPAGGPPTAGDGAAALAASPQPPTTVALVAVTAPGGAFRSDRDPVTSAELAEDSPEGVALAAVERSLRSAARGTDRVELLATGRYRVVLAATGELAARAYLRRVRATVQSLLDELDPPRSLAVATATVLDEPLARANATAERRLQALLEARRLDAGDAPKAPRAAPD